MGTWPDAERGRATAEAAQKTAQALQQLGVAMETVRGNIARTLHVLFHDTEDRCYPQHCPWCVQARQELEEAPRDVP